MTAGSEMDSHMNENQVERWNRVNTSYYNIGSFKVQRGTQGRLFVCTDKALVTAYKEKEWFQQRMHN